MASIRKKIIRKNAYYYLEHSIKVDGKVQKKERYLGKEIPKNIDLIKKQFILDIKKEKYYDTFNKIKENYQKYESTIPKTAREKEFDNFAVKFTYNTQRIEGSTLSLRETANLLKEKITPKEKPLSDVIEAKAHNKLFHEMIKTKKDISEQIILFWHNEMFKDTKKDIAGKIRRHGVAISGSKFTPPSPVELRVELNEFFKWYNQNKKKIHPVELSAHIHLKFVTVHPFTYGNGRISRLLMNFILNKNKFPLLNIDFDKRIGYYTALEKSQIRRDESYFLKWFYKRYIKENKEFLS